MSKTAEQTVKERPIIFSAEMVKALLAGKKTQTRRVVKQQPVGGDTIVDSPVGWVVGRMRDSENAWRSLPCPYGQPGDRLWVRETWSRDHANFYPCFPLVLRADGYPDDWELAQWKKDADRHTAAFRWHSPIHMARRDSRLTLEITNVRVERLQDISEEDARAEGVDLEVPYGAMPDHANFPAGFDTWSEIRKDDWFKRTARATFMAQCQAASNAVDAFAARWDRLNGKRGYSWESNPWVWAITFGVLKT